jgi:hypothetical protein
MSQRFAAFLTVIITLIPIVARGQETPTERALQATAALRSVF